MHVLLFLFDFPSFLLVLFARNQEIQLMMLSFFLEIEKGPCQGNGCFIFGFCTAKQMQVPDATIFVLASTSCSNTT